MPSSFNDAEAMLALSAALVGGVEESDWALERDASFVAVLRMESVDAQRVKVSLEEAASLGIVCLE